MKRKGIFLLICIACFLFSSCEKPNMTELLAYESESLRFVLHIHDEKDFSVILTHNQEKDTLLFTDEALSGIFAEWDADGTIKISYEDYKISLPHASLLKAVRWKELFHLSEKNLLWKIERESLGGLSVYACRSGNVTVFVDAATHLPLQIRQNSLVIDVLESTALSP